MDLTRGDYYQIFCKQKDILHGSGGRRTDCACERMGSCVVLRSAAAHNSTVGTRQ